MIKVKMNTCLAGPDYACDAGKHIDLPDELAEALISDGNAERVGDAPAPPAREVEQEQATAEPEAEKAVTRRGRPRKAGA